MAKRSAGRELTKDNWDEKDEVEEAGEFSKASQDTMKQRQIIKAKRKHTPTGGTPAFAGFGGFAFKPTQTSTPLVGFGMKAESKIGSKNTVGEPSSQAEPVKTHNGQSENGSGASPDRTSYLTNLKVLNESVLKWITQHVEKNPYLILTPIFKDYEKHLNDLEKEKEKVASDTKPSQTVSESEKKPSVTESEKTSEDTGEKPELPKTGLTFGMGLMSTAKTVGGPSATPFSGFNFGKASAPATATSGFSFAVGKLDAPSGSMESIKESANEDEEYVPPKPEVTEVEEEGSLFSKKCKLFYQKEGSWTERGVGHLHLKDNGGKTQLLVRADTSLGNILLNIMLSSSIPVSKQGKNNVSLVCVPNPPIDPKSDSQQPVPMLIRVKTSDDADALISKISEINK